MRFSSLLFSAATASAAVIARQENASTAKVLIGSPGTISVADFNGKEFNIVANYSDAGATASWMIFKEPNLIYAVNENNNETRLFNFDTATNELKFVQAVNGSSGVVFLEFNSDKTRLVGASYGQGTIDVWDISSSSGELKLMKQLTSDDPLGPNPVNQAVHHPHQAKLDPSGRFFAVNDLGSDTVLIIDSKDDAFNIVNRNRVPTAGCGPRHGVWYPAKAEKATHYMVVCEMKNLIQVFSVSYNGSGIALTRTQELSTYGKDFPPANATTAAAGEIQIVGKDVYVSNRLSGNDTDSISHFKVKELAATGGAPCKAAAGGITLEFVEAISSGGVRPRMFSLSKDEKTLFSGNQEGDLGLVAFGRAEDAGKLTAAALGSLPISDFGAPTNGPQFVQQIA